MFENEIKKYQALNELAEQNGIVIIGGTEDKDIPLCELKQAFELNSNLYNRSVSNISVSNASKVYDDCVAELNPESVLLHIGTADLQLFEENSSEFDRKYRDLIKHIRTSNPKCSIAIVSLKKQKETSDVTELNKHLRYIADSEQCDFADISVPKVWNPKQTKNVVSFVYSIGFVQALKNKRPVYDLVKILFCYDPIYSV